jgi:hypothetical protein
MEDIDGNWEAVLDLGANVRPAVETLLASVNARLKEVSWAFGTREGIE